MQYHNSANFRVISGIALAAIFLVTGCQTGPNGVAQWPWQKGSVAGSGRSNTWRPPSNPFQPPGGWSNPTPTADNRQVLNPNGPLGDIANRVRNPLARIPELMQRQNEQTRLSEEQRQALAELTQYQQVQERMLQEVSARKRNEQIAKIQAQSDLVRRQQEELAGLAEMRRRALELDANNRDLHAQLAQTQQQNRLLEDKSRLLRQQLKDTAGQLSGALDSQTTAARRAQEAESLANQRIQKAEAEAALRMQQVQGQSAEQIRQMQAYTQQQVAQARASAQQQYQRATQSAQQQMRAMETSIGRRGGATIRANSSANRRLNMVNIAGLNVRQDGDVIRIEIPTDQIFAAGASQLNGNATQLLGRVATAVRQNYPRQVIGIEAHTDNLPPSGGQWTSGHQLSAAQAATVFEELTSKYQFGARQLFVLGHGANYPVASNGTPAGQQRNRRVEVVIYPETVDHQ